MLHLYAADTIISTKAYSVNLAMHTLQIAFQSLHVSERFRFVFFTHSCISLDKYLLLNIRWEIKKVALNILSVLESELMKGRRNVKTENNNNKKKLSDQSLVLFSFKKAGTELCQFWIT